MNGAYRLLFDVVCLHGYFGMQPCATLSMAPTPACLRLLGRYRLRWRPLAGGVEVSYPSVDPLVPLSTFDETAAFEFVLTGDPSLVLYTADARIGPYRFDNRDSGADGLLRPSSLATAAAGADARTWGVVSIFGGGRAQDGAGLPIAPDGTPRARHYRLALDARSCTWRYYLVATGPGRPALDGDVLALRGRSGDTADDAPGFRRVAQPATVGGRPAAVFESRQPLPLLAVPDAALAYWFRPSGADGSDVALPYAAPDGLAADPQAPGGLRADIYVYM